MSEWLKVLIFGEQPVIRTGMRWMLEEDPSLQVVGEVDSLERARRAIRDARPNVLLAELSVGPRDDVLEGCLALADTIGTVVLAMSEDSHDIAWALSRGIDGYLLRDATAVEVVAAIRAVANGGRYLDPRVGANVIDSLMPSSRIGGVGGTLSHREEQVFRLLARGYKNSEIAMELGISIRTVETHRAKVNQKLGRPTRAEIVRLAEAAI